MSEIQDLFERQYPNENSTSSFDRPPSPDGPRRIPLDLADSKINKADSQDSRKQLKNIKSLHQYQNSSLFQTQEYGFWLFSKSNSVSNLATQLFIILKYLKIILIKMTSTWTKRKLPRKRTENTLK